LLKILRVLFGRKVAFEQETAWTVMLR